MRHSWCRRAVTTPAGDLTMLAACSVLCARHVFRVGVRLAAVGRERVRHVGRWVGQGESHGGWQRCPIRTVEDRLRKDARVDDGALAGDV